MIDTHLSFISTELACIMPFSTFLFLMITYFPSLLLLLLLFLFLKAKLLGSLMPLTYTIPEKKNPIPCKGKRVSGTVQPSLDQFSRLLLECDLSWLNSSQSN